MTFLNTDLIRVSANCTFSAGVNDLISVMYFELLSPSSLADSLVLADIGQVLEVIYTTIIAAQNLNITYVDYTVKNETQDAAPLTATWPVLTNGTNATEALPSQIAGLLVLRTAKSRKSGRVNIGGLTEAASNSNIWTAPTLGSLGNFVTQLLTTHIAVNGNYRYGVATQAVLPPRTIANSFDPPISGKVIGLARTQRRRSGGFGS